MKRKIEIADVMVSIGMVATLLGAYAFFLATDSGAVSVSHSGYRTTDYTVQAFVQAKLQPAIGQAIVDQALLDRQFAGDMGRGARKLASAMRARERQSNWGAEPIETWAALMTAEHKARVQYVMGRSIVRLTKQGIRSGAISADNLSNRTNTRIIETAQSMGRTMQDAWKKNWQSRLGQQIVESATQRNRYHTRIQERLGHATIDVASMQHAYQAKRAGIQSQFEALTAAADRTETQPDLFARLPQENLNWQRALGIPIMPQEEVLAAGAFSEIPLSYVMFVSLGFATMLFFGWSLPRRERRAQAMASRMNGGKGAEYRKAG